MRFRNLWISLTLLLVGSLPAIAIALEVTNVKAAQRTGAKLVDITYDLKTDDTNPVAIQVMISDDGGATFNVKAQTFSGDVGTSVLGGVGRRIVWDAGTDVPNVSGTRYLAKVIATAGGTSANGRVWFLTAKTPGSTDDEIWSMEPDGSSATKMVELTFGNNYGTFAIKPDGTEIVFVHAENGYKLKIRKTSGGLATQILDSGGTSINFVSYSPDGLKIAFVQGSSTAKLVILDVSSLSAIFNSTLPQSKDFDTQVRSTLAALFGPVWSPDGTRIFITGNPVSYYSSSFTWGSIYTMKSDGTGLRAISSAGDSGPVAIAPDGSLIAYARQDKGVFLANPDGTRETQLTAQKGYRISWSPDGKSVFFEDQDVKKLYKINLDGTGLQTIDPKGTGRFAPWYPVWTKR